MTGLLILTSLSLIAAWGFALMQSKDQATYVGRLHDEHNREREQWNRERQYLLNRIKPETAQPVPIPGPQVQLPAVGFDDDQDFWESRDPTSELSTSELADQLMQLELEERDGVPSQ